MRVARRRINELRWLRVGTDSISEARGLLTSRIPGTRLRAQRTERAPEAGGGEKSDYSFDLEVFSEVSFRSCL